MGPGAILVLARGGYYAEDQQLADQDAEWRRSQEGRSEAAPDLAPLADLAQLPSTKKALRVYRLRLSDFSMEPIDTRFAQDMPEAVRAVLLRCLTKDRFRNDYWGESNGECEFKVSGDERSVGTRPPPVVEVRLVKQSPPTPEPRFPWQEGGNDEGPSIQERIAEALGMKPDLEVCTPCFRLCMESWEWSFSRDIDSCDWEVVDGEGF